VQDHYAPRAAGRKAVRYGGNGAACVPYRELYYPVPP
jgi:hypothetical protein